MIPQDIEIVRQVVQEELSKLALSNFKTPHHTHNDLDSPRIDGKNLVGAPQPAILPVTGTAGGTYSATEQTLINEHTTAITTIREVLKKLNLTL